MYIHTYYRLGYYRLLHVHVVRDIARYTDIPIRWGGLFINAPFKEKNLRCLLFDTYDIRYRTVAVVFVRSFIISRVSLVPRSLLSFIIVKLLNRLSS